METTIRVAFTVLWAAIAAAVIWTTVRAFSRPSKRQVKVYVCVILTAMILHPLSVGPAIWIYEKSGHPEWLQIASEYFYAPEDLAFNKGPLWVRNAQVAHFELWMPETPVPARDSD